MTTARREKAAALISELKAVRSEVCVLREAEAAEGGTLLSGLNCEALGEAAEHIEAAIGMMEEAVG